MLLMQFMKSTRFNLFLTFTWILIYFFLLVVYRMKIWKILNQGLKDNYQDLNHIMLVVFQMCLLWLCFLVIRIFMITNVCQFLAQLSEMYSQRYQHRIEFQTNACFSQYSLIDSVLWQCESSRNNQNNSNDGTKNTLSINRAGGHSYGYGNGQSGARYGGKLPPHLKMHRSPEEISVMKNKMLCHFCKRNGLAKYGHWSPDHNPNGSLKPGTTSPDITIDENSKSDGSSSHQSTNFKSKVALGFNSKVLNDDTLHLNIAASDILIFIMGLLSTMVHHTVRLELLN